MRTRPTTVTDLAGRTHQVQLREMTLGEIRAYNANCTIEEHLQTVCKAQAALLPDLPFSEAQRLSREIADLTFGTEDDLKNSESTGAPSSTPAAASTATPVGG